MQGRDSVDGTTAVTCVLDLYAQRQPASARRFATLLCEAQAFRAHVDGLVAPTGASRTRQRAFERALARRAVADPLHRRLGAGQQPESRRASRFTSEVTSVHSR